MHDAVRVISAAEAYDKSMSEPKLGDIGIVIMVHSSPKEGYTVEGVGTDHRVSWLAAFDPIGLAISD